MHRNQTCDPVIADALAAMRMSPRALNNWLLHLREFARAHGGEARYAKLLALVKACEAAVKS